MKKVELTLKQMVEALKENGKEPWDVLGLGRSTWFRSLAKNGVTMTELQSQCTETSEVSTEVQTRKVNPVPQWSPEVTNESNAVGRPRGVGGVRYRYTDTEKYNEFRKEDAFRILERELKKQMKIETERSDKMTTKEVAQICGVTDECIRQNAKVMGVELGDRWHPHEWTDEEMKKLQVMLMKNQVSQGSTDSESTVRKVTQTALGEGLAINVLSNSGDVEAMREYCEMLIQKTQAQHELLLAQKQNQLLLEQKEEAEKETERIYQVNKNFHSNLYTASQIAKKLGITANMVGRIANEHGLKQDPIYGKLGKIQLNNGQWVNQFYYNDDALTVMEAVIG